MATRPRILVVDDDPHVIDVLRQWFDKEGCDTVVAQNGEEAFRILDEPPGVDIVLTDFMMPELNGIELVRRLNATNKLLDTKVVVMSNNADPGFRKRAMEFGASAYLMKTDGARSIAQYVVRMIQDAQRQQLPRPNPSATPIEVATMQRSLLALIRLAAASEGLPNHARTALKTAEEIAEQLFGKDVHT